MFRSFYGANRDEMILNVPLAGLTLIGTGEIWRVEYGQVVTSYQPREMVPKIKGLMHAVLGVHGVWGLLLRNKKSEKARQALEDLMVALGEAIERSSSELPLALAAPARTVLFALYQLGVAWSSGVGPSLHDFPDAVEGIRASLDEVIRLTGDAVYESLVGNFKAFRDESTEDQWRNAYMGVCGPGQGRRNNIEMAAASAVMGAHSMGLRLLYLENVFTIPDGIRLLASMLVEQDLGQAVFNDPFRMWRDLLADAAVKHYGHHFFPELGPGSTA